LTPEKEPSSSSQNSPEPRGLLSILVLAFLFLWPFSRLRSQRAKKRIDTIRDSDEAECQYKHPSQHVNIRAELHTPEHIERQRTENQNRNYRLQAWLVVGTWLAFIAAAIYAGITFRIWHQMEEQTKTAQSQLEAVDRPWLKITFTPDPITFQQGGMQIGLRAKITNVGRSVATGVVIPLRGFLAYDANTIFKEPLKRQRELCGKLVEEPVSKHLDETQITVFPDSTDDSRQTGISFSKSEIDAAPSANPNYAEKRLLPIVIGCVDYQYGTSTHHHQTGFIYEVQRLDPITPPHVFTIQLNREIPATNVILTPYAFGGFAAN
jgi:hypothetical protein